MRRCDATSTAPAYAVRRDDLSAGPLRIINARRLARTRERDVYSPPGTGVKHIKAPVVITGDRPVTVAVAPAGRDELALAYHVDDSHPRSVAEASSVVEFEACAREGRVTGYAGVLVDGGPWKRCVALEFRVEGRRQPIHRTLSLGAGPRC